MQSQGKQESSNESDIPVGKEEECDEDIRHKINQKLMKK